MQTTFHDKIMNTIHLMGGGKIVTPEGKMMKSLCTGEAGKNVLKKLKVKAIQNFASGSETWRLE